MIRPQEGPIVTDSRGVTLSATLSPIATPITVAPSEYSLDFEERWSVWRARGIVEAQRTRQLATGALVLVSLIAAIAVASVFLSAGN